MELHQQITAKVKLSEWQKIVYPGVAVAWLGRIV
jgi:hypothetical protein